jgi:thioredoxin 1
MLRAARAPAAVLLLLAMIAAGCGGGGSSGGTSGGTGGATGDTIGGQPDGTVTSPPANTITSQPAGTERIAATTVTDSTFEAEVLQSEKAVLVHFWAEWCGPCRLLMPALEEIGGEHQAKLTVATLNVDDNPETPARFEVKTIPTLSLFVGGVEKKHLSGARSKDEIVSELAEFIN